MNDERLPDWARERVRDLEAWTSDFQASVSFLSKEEGGRITPICSGSGFPCKLSEDSEEANDARIVFDQNWAEAGETVIASFYFLGGENVGEAFRQAGHFSIWEAKIIAKATAVSV